MLRHWRPPQSNTLSSVPPTSNKNTADAQKSGVETTIEHLIQGPEMLYGATGYFGKQATFVKVFF
jgi:hypothetical protein